MTSIRRFVTIAPVAVGILVATAAPPAAATQATSALSPLTDVAIARVLVGDQVAAAKFGTDQPIDDPVREQQVLDQARQQALALGIDPEATVAFFQDQISASKVVQHGLFRLWTAHPDQAPTTRPDLATIRQELDQITTRIMSALKSTQDIRHRTPRCYVELVTAKLSGEFTNHLDALHRHALNVAVASVCTPQ